MDLSARFHQLPFPALMLEVLGRLQAQSANFIPSSFYIFDVVKQHTVASSSSIASMLGYSADAIQKMELDELASLIHQDDLQYVSEHYQRLLTLPDGAVISLEYRMRRSDGTWCYLKSQETPLLTTTNGFPIQILGLIQDITDLSHSVSNSAYSEPSYGDLLTLSKSLKRTQPLQYIRTFSKAPQRWALVKRK